METNFIDELIHILCLLCIWIIIMRIKHNLSICNSIQNIISALNITFGPIHNNQTLDKECINRVFKNKILQIMPFSVIIINKMAQLQTSNSLGQTSKPTTVENWEWWWWNRIHLQYNNKKKCWQTNIRHFIIQLIDWILVELSRNKIWKNAKSSFGEQWPTHKKEAYHR